MNAERPQTCDFDAIVVGSGATGGVAALELSRQGLRTLVLEAGPALRGPGSYGSGITNLGRALGQRLFSRRQFNQEWHAGYWETNPELFVDDTHHPYTTPDDQPYRWIRGRQVGGRTHTWGGVTLRFSDHEFKAGRDGLSPEWPISTADLSPFYDRLEGFFGVHGARDGLTQLPDGNFLEPSGFSPGEALFKRRVEGRFGRRVIISRGIHARRSAEKGERFSRLSSPRTTLAAAHETGNLSLASDSIVCGIMVDRSTGRANGVEYIDRRTRDHRWARARVVFLCASSIESLRILMMSHSPTHPQGIGAQSGLLGKGLMDHIVSNHYFFMPEVAETNDFELLGSDSIIIPRYQNLTTQSSTFRRGFGLWGGISRMKFPWPLRRRESTALGFLCAMGETLPDDGNAVTLNTSVTDAWGLPVPHIACKWTENDLKLAAAMRSDTEEMIEAAGGELTTLPQVMHTPLVGEFMKTMQKQWELTVPGLFVHEVGGARMGTSPRDSVTNPFCQIWEAPNVFVTDGACWVSSGWQNPTLTEMAITARACERAAGLLKAGDL
jgi:choline dehydrogenase-like flavoprotein